MRHSICRSVPALATAILGILIAIAICGKHTSATADALPSNDQMKSLFSEKCSACHDLPDPVEKGYTQVEWQSTVNRMLTAHGASNSISNLEATEIVDYLGQFAPTTQLNNAPHEIGVWQTDPILSVAYPFTYPPTLQDFDRDGGAWKIIQTSDITSGYLKHSSSVETPALLLENKNIVQNALDLSVQFHVNQSTSSSTIGLVFGALDSQNYLAAEFSPANNTVSLVKVVGGQAQLLKRASVNETSNTRPDGWHQLRVKVTEGGTALEVSADYQTAIKTTETDWQGGRVGLLSSGPIIAGFRQMIFDTYDSSSPSPASAILLH
jgi:hypothetical protein